MMVLSSDDTFFIEESPRIASGKAFDKKPNTAMVIIAGTIRKYVFFFIAFMHFSIYELQNSFGTEIRKRSPKFA